MESTYQVVNQASALVLSNAGLISPIYRTLSLLFGPMIAFGALNAIFQPRAQAKSFGVPLPEASGSSTTATSKSESLPPYMGDPEEFMRPWFISMAGPRAALGILILVLLYMDELKVLGVVQILINLLGIADVCAT